VSHRSESRAEAAKLSRLLGTGDPEGPAFLLSVPAGELREYRGAVTEMLYDDDLELLRRTADAARLLPARTLAAIGENALGPLICARLTGLLDPRRAVEIAEHFTVDFLALLAAELDPRRAVDVVTAIADDTAVAVCAAMAAGGEHVAMGRFVAYLDDAALGRCVEALSDEDLLRTACVVEGEEHLSRIYEMIGAERAERLLAAARTEGLAEEADHVVERLHSLHPGAVSPPLRPPPP
jgi:hypothetical protein